MDIAFDQLPIPEWDLCCPHCAYPLRGLPSHRCPECGHYVDIEQIVRPWHRLRPPRFTGAELPVPDFGLGCTDCGRAVAGLASHVCPGCGREFDLQRYGPAKAWFVLDHRLTGELAIPGVQSILGAEHVPHFPVGELTVAEIYGGRSMTVTALHVPAEFFFEVLWLLQRIRSEVRASRGAGARPPWSCPSCGEENPGNFELCWSCEATRR